MTSLIGKKMKIQKEWGFNIYGDLNIHKPQIYKMENERGDVFLLPHGVELFMNYPERLEFGLLNLFSNEKIVEYEKHLRMTSSKDVLHYIKDCSSKQLKSQQYNYYIICERFNIILGVIINISHIGIKTSLPAVYNTIKDNFSQYDIEKSWLMDFYAIPDFWGTNLMRDFMNQMINIHRKQGYCYFFAFVKAENNRTIDFFNARGFIRLNHVDFYNQDGKILMVLDLSD